MNRILIQMSYFSVTDIIKQYFTPYDTQAHIKEVKDPLSNHPLKDFDDRHILEVWDTYNKFTKKMGKELHKIIERKLRGDSEISPISSIPLNIKYIEGLENYIHTDIIKTRELVLSKFFEKELMQFSNFLFHLNSLGYVFYDAERKIKIDNITGVIDAIFINENEKTFLIVDWKWCKDDFKECDKKIDFKDEKISDNKFGLYKLQLMAYKKLFRNEMSNLNSYKNFSIKTMLVQFHSSKIDFVKYEFN